MKGMVEYSNFHSYNKFMAMKMKKKDKLRAEDIPKIRIDTSEDSSVDSSDDSVNIDHKPTDIKIYDPDQLRASVDSNESQGNLLGLNLNKKILVNEKMFKNFLGPMVGGEEELKRLATERFNIKKEEQALKKAEEHFKESLI